MVTFGYNYINRSFKPINDFYNINLTEMNSPVS